MRIGTHRIQLALGDGAVVLADVSLPATGDSVMVRVEDADVDPADWGGGTT